MKAASAVILAVTLLWCGSAAAAESKSLRLVQSVRTLDKLYDAAARGNGDAPQVAARLLKQIARHIEAMDAKDLGEPSAVRGLALYMLSGGKPDPVLRLLGQAKLPEEQQTLLAGIAAFARGDSAAARRLLAKIDAASLAPSLGGRLALVQAMVAPAQDAAKALALLRLARHLMPGTLVEEAALRRGIAIAVEIDDAAEIEGQADLYIRRFAASAYAAPFERQLALSLLHAAGKTDARLAGIEALLDPLPPDMRRRIYLTMAAAAARRGRVVAAQFAAARAYRLAAPGSIEVARAELYDGAVAIVGADYDAGLTKLRSLERSQLPKPDAKLLDSALDIARQIRRDARGSDGFRPMGPSRDPLHIADFRSIEQVLQRANKAMADTDAAIKEGML